MRVIIDTNVLISALGWGGKPQEVIEYCINNNIKLVFSRDTKKELIDVLNRKRFNFLDNSLKNEFFTLLEGISKLVVPKGINKYSRDVNDNKFLMITHHADYLVTGDEDLLVLEKYLGTQIVTPHKFLEIINE